MKAMILAAGLGTRLRPLTDRIPKALVEVGGEPMLSRVIKRLKDFGADYIVVNIHHLGSLITEYLAENDFGVETRVSDEREMLMDTGGGVAHASELLLNDNEPILIHNVDILSNADLGALMDHHKMSGNDITLLTSDRESTRRLVFDQQWRLIGWHNTTTDEKKPAGFEIPAGAHEEAFSGIYVINADVVERLMEFGAGKPFGIMEFMLSSWDSLKIGRLFSRDLKLIDIGKPATLSQANNII